MYTVNSPLRAPGAEVRPKGVLLSERGLSHLPVGFYRMKIGPFLAEIWPKTSRKASMLGVKRGGGGALIGGGALNGEFTVSFAMIQTKTQTVNSIYFSYEYLHFSD